MDIKKPDSRGWEQADFSFLILAAICYLNPVRIFTDSELARPSNLPIAGFRCYM